MRKVLYSPILKFKKGEQDALKGLSDSTKDVIIPVLEITSDHNLGKIQGQIEACWNNRMYYFDVAEELYDTYFQLLNDCDSSYVIPVLNLDDDIETISQALQYAQNGIALRIFSTDYDRVNSTLEELISKNIIQADNTDIIVDLQKISPNKEEKGMILSSLLLEIPNIKDFRSIIISSNSFPEDFSSINTNSSSAFPRDEEYIHRRSLVMSERLGFNYIYSDYGPSGLEVVEFVPGMSPAFKIKYSTETSYICYKGMSGKKQGMNIDNVQPLCEDLVSSGAYSGENFSVGDAYIYSIYTREAQTAGNPTTWVQVAQNHHIELIISFLSN